MTKNKTNLIKNFSYLTILQLLNLFLPLFSYPYLITVLTKEIYGEYILASSIVAYFSAIVNQGYDITASKKSSQYRKKLLVLSKLYTSISILKVCILFTLFIPFYVVIKYFLTVTDVFFYVFCYFQINIYNLIPIWLFQGLEEMKFITIVNGLIKIISFFLIFLLINTVDDYYKLPLLYFISNLTGLIITHFILLKKKIRITQIKTADIKIDFFNSLPFFGSRVINIINDKTNAIVIGLSLGLEQLALYDLAVKIISIMRIPFDNLVQVLYPNVAKTKNIFTVKKVLMISLVCGLFCFLGLLFFGYIPIKILGHGQMDEAFICLKILSFSCLAISISLPLGASTLVVFNKQKYYNRSVLYGFLSYLVVLSFFLFTKQLTLYKICLLYLIPEVVIAIYRFFHSFKLLFSKRGIYNEIN